MPLAFVDGAGTTTEPHSDRFTDRSLPRTARRLECRLRQVDLDGTGFYSEVMRVERGTPVRFALHPCYPNPAGRRVTIPFDVSAPIRVRLAVYDVLGRRVATLVDRDYPPGRHTAAADTRRLTSGLYFTVAEMGSYRGVQKLVVAR